MTQKPELESLNGNPVDGQTLRAAMRTVPSAVTVVTVGGPEPRGITIGSFTSVSLDPPLISFNVQRQARMHQLLLEAERFVVHVLRADQVHLSNHFADPDLTGAEQFAIEEVAFDGDGTPRLSGVLASFDCIPFAAHDAGDHALVVGHVDRVSTGDEGDPVLYYDRAYHGVGSVLTSRD